MNVNNDTLKFHILCFRWWHTSTNYTVQLSGISISHCTWRPSQITIANFKSMTTSDRNSLPILIAVNGCSMRVCGPSNWTDKPIRHSQNLDRHIQLSEMRIPVDGAHVKLPPIPYITTLPLHGLIYDSILSTNANFISCARPYSTVIQWIEII